MSFYISYLYKNEFGTKKITEKNQNKKAVLGTDTASIKNVEEKELNQSSVSTLNREVASLNAKDLISLDSSVEVEVPKAKLSVSTLEKTEISTTVKIEMLQKDRVDLSERSKAKKVILNELMRISFVERNIDIEEMDDISDMGKDLESLSPPDSEVYFFELYNQLTKIVDRSDLKAISLDLYERVDNKEARGLVILHLLDNDLKNDNLNFLVDNLSEDKVLKYTPDNYTIKNMDGERYLVINDGPVYDEESDLVDVELNESTGNKNEEVL